MGIFDRLRKKPKVEAARANDVPSPGWNAITRAFDAIYPEQTNPVHRAPLVYRMHDTAETAAAFDGISAYDAGDHWHFVTYGLTELYEKTAEDLTTSGFGYEFTFKLPKRVETPPLWAFDLLESIGKAVWKGQVFAAGHTIKTGPIDGRESTRETALIVVPDPALPNPIDSPHGRVQFLLLVGVEDEYRQRLLRCSPGSEGEDEDNPVLVELRSKNPRLITQTAGI